MTNQAAVHARAGGMAGVGLGTRVVVAIVALAIGLGLFALWFQWRQTRRCLTFYGTETARLIQRATRVEVWERAAAGADADGTAAADRDDSFVRRADVSAARGLVHLRRGLVEDANLDWARLDDRPMSPEAWDLALAFFEPAGAASPAAVLLIEGWHDPSGEGPLLAVEGRPGRVGLGRLSRGIERWWRAVRGDAVPVATDGPVDR